MKDLTINSSSYTFYKEVFCSFDKCKRKPDISHLPNVNFIKQPLWNNEFFQYNEKSISLKNGSKTISNM